jgi:hypothetical protein
MLSLVQGERSILVEKLLGIIAATLIVTQYIYQTHAMDATIS